MKYIESPGTDPMFNLALEQHVFEGLDRRESYFMLWRNDKAVVMGKNQNALEEINSEYVAAHGIKVVRRLSGGGAVYHDLGNLNYTFIDDSTDDGEFRFLRFCRPIISALAALGLQAQVSGRNDMLIRGRKFSGNAQYSRAGRVMHHGTLMFDSNLDVLSRVLQVSGGKIVSKGIKSVQSRVTNIRPHLPQDIAFGDFFQAVRDHVCAEYDCSAYALTEEDLAQVRRIRKERYARWEWNYGRSPSCTIKKTRFIEGCGTLQVYMSVKNGSLSDLELYGDFFGDGDISRLVNLLRGCDLEERALSQRLASTDVGSFIHGLSTREFLSILQQA